MPDLIPSVLGDFVLAWGDRQPGAGWLAKLAGFSLITSPGAAIQVAIRGAAQHGTAPDGSRWVAVADLIEGQLETGVPMPWRGRFTHVSWHEGSPSVIALSDHFSSLPLYTMIRDDALVVGTDLRLLAQAPGCARTVDLASVYHYLNFGVIPAPSTIFTEIRRHEPSMRLSWKPGRASWERYYLPEYPEDLRGSDDALAHELQERMIASVNAFRPAGTTGWGTFLSGGTDSSSITSILAKRGPVRSFSIGFAEEDYDELGFARIAAKACGADPTFHSVSREEAQKLVARLTQAHDQPFGNASSVPTLACADLAHAKGVTLLLGGDGGDEIFGGNERYAKDRIMEAWYAMPAPIRAVGKAVGGVAGRTDNFFLNRVENFFARASVPNPDRFYTDDSFASDHYDELLTPEFRRAVPRDASLDWMRGVYGLGQSGGPLHRVMRLDLLNAIAQHDLRKVDSATRAAGVSARFPYLDPPLVAWVNRLPEKHKVRGLKKRYLFKRAMRGILPDEILKKKKQGFGLPISVWLRKDAAFQAMVRETLFDGRARARRWWEPAFVERLLAEHERAAWDHADYIWRLLMLELWMRSYVDAA